MFKRILIANRGEIACRIIRTASRMGIGTVAVYSDADRSALHVEMADMAYPIGPAAARASYLDAAKIVEACRASGADAVHPGYGFLSEQAQFAEALTDAGIVFIGPNAHAIAAMGDKIESKRRAVEAGVCVVPGAPGAVETANAALAFARELGFPVILKASAGGGGKGMRIAWGPDDVAEGFARASSEALASFGDGRLLIEKYITAPRHIEIQVLGDKHGNVVHLGERECSIQRRNQKILEEAPSPHIDAATREAMGREAVQLAKAVGYDSAGTVEFVAGQDRSYYFLEMNTRLQVEHPVTEFVTGIDLVEQMIRIAAGEPLAFDQSDVSLAGWAVESRIYAEDPERDFLPSTGRLVRFRPPPEITHGPVRLRNDTGVVEGGEITIHYDPMISKLITHAPTRLQAIEAQADALDGYYIDGIRHNIPFLAAVMQNSRWRDGHLSTDFIREEFPDGFKPLTPHGEDLEVLIAVAAAIDALTNLRRRAITQQASGRPVRFSRHRVVMLADTGHRVDVEGRLGEACDVVLFDDEGKISARHCVISEWWPGVPIWQGSVGKRQVQLAVRPILNGCELSFRGSVVAARVFTQREAELAKRIPPRPPRDQTKLVLCPMPGLVRSITVTPGQLVRAGDAVAVIEAMKMENVVRAERDGQVKAVGAAAGDNLPVDHVIVEFE